jgi:hypothetical protein
MGWNEALVALRTMKSRRQAYAILKSACERGIFCRKVRCAESGRLIIKLTGQAALIAHFGERSSGKAYVKTVDVFGPSYRQVMYLAWIAERNGRPTARTTRTLVTGVGRTSQIRAEKHHRVRRERNYIRHAPDSGISREEKHVHVLQPDGQLIEEISGSTYVPTTVVRPSRRRVSAPENNTGVYKRRSQRRYHHSRDQLGMSAKRSGQWANAKLGIAGGNRLLVEANPSQTWLIENRTFVRYWEEV